MAFMTFTAGQALTASQVNTYLAKQAVVVCTSTTRPASPPEGMVIYETDTDRLLVYTSSATGWVPPWNKPWGVVPATSGGTGGYGYHRNTSNQSITATSSPGTDLTGATVTFTAYANRLYRITGMADMTNGASLSIGSLNVVIDGSAAGANTIATLAAVAGGVQDRMAVVNQITTLSAGSHTIKLAAWTSSGTLTIGGSASAPTIFCVEDAGPVGAPA